MNFTNLSPETYYAMDACGGLSDSTELRLRGPAKCLRDKNSAEEFRKFGAIVWLDLP